MDADIKGCLSAINKSYRAFEHKGKLMTKAQVRAVLEFGLSQGFEKVSEIPDADVERILGDLSVKDTYFIQKDPYRITCLFCNKTSHSLGDIMNLYCGHCKKFH